MNLTATNTDSSDGYGPQVKHYGGSAAVCFQSSMLKERIPTINIEIAPIVSNSVQWGNKLNFQLSDNELPLLCGLLLGYLPALDIKRGAKGIELRRQKRDATNHPGLFLYASSGRSHQLRLLVPSGVMAKICALAVARFVEDLAVDPSVAHMAIKSACALHY